MMVQLPPSEELTPGFSACYWLQRQAGDALSVTVRCVGREADEGCLLSIY